MINLQPYFHKKNLKLVIKVLKLSALSFRIYSRTTLAHANLFYLKRNSYGIETRRLLMQQVPFIKCS